jgi:hypothetical protein
MSPKWTDLTVLQLEDRINPVPWPIIPTNQPHPILD